MYYRQSKVIGSGITYTDTIEVHQLFLYILKIIIFIFSYPNFPLKTYIQASSGHRLSLKTLDTEKIIH